MQLLLRGQLRLLRSQGGYKAGQELNSRTPEPDSHTLPPPITTKAERMAGRAEQNHVWTQAGTKKLLRELTENSRRWTCCALCLHYWVQARSMAAGCSAPSCICSAPPDKLQSLIAFPDPGGGLREGCGGRPGCGVGSSSWLAPRWREFRSQRRWPYDGVPVTLDGLVLSRENRKQVGHHDFRSSGGHLPHILLRRSRWWRPIWLAVAQVLLPRGGCGPP